MLEQTMQVEALRLLTAWWDSSRPTRASWRWRRAGAATTTTVAVPSGYQPAHLDERLAEVS